MLGALPDTLGGATTDYSLRAGGRGARRYAIVFDPRPWGRGPRLPLRDNFRSASLESGDSQCLGHSREDDNS
jgi:hypothetical protein